MKRIRIVDVILNIYIYPYGTQIAKIIFFPIKNRDFSLKKSIIQLRRGGWGSGCKIKYMTEFLLREPTIFRENNFCINLTYDKFEMD